MAHIAIDARIISSSTGRYVERLVNCLQDVDPINHYTILVRAKDEHYFTPRVPNFSVQVADFDNYSFREQIGFKFFLDRLAPDLVHFCMPQQPILYRGPKVTTFHDLTLVKTYNSDKNWFVYHAKQLVGKFVFKKVARDSDHIIAISHYTATDLRSFVKIPKEKVTVTHEAGEVTSTEQEPYPAPYTQYLLYVGQYSDYKNIKRLGDAHQQLLKTHPNLGLILVGKKNDAAEKVADYFAQRHYQNIHFTGFVSDAQLNWLYAHALTYVFPSLMEGFGLPGLEAMAHGVPVVSSNATCLPEIYGSAAQYFDPLNTEQMAQAIDAVLSDPQLRERLIAAGTEQHKKYSWARMAQETHQVYEKVLNYSPEQS